MKQYHHEHFFNINGKRLCAVVTEPEAVNESTTTLLALHGWMDNAASYTKLTNLLPEFRWVALEMAGHGRSDHRPQGVPYHFVDYVIDAYQVLLQVKELYSGPLFVVGHSLGAGVSSAMTAIGQEYIEGLICLEGLAPQVDSIEGISTSLKRAAEAAVKYQKKPPARGSRVVESLELLVDVRIKAGFPISREAALQLMERATVLTQQGYRLLTDGALNGPSPLRLTQAHLLHLFNQIDLPVMVLVGEQGMPVKSDHFNELVGALKDSTVHTLPGGHHFHMEESGLRIAQLIREYVEQRAGQSCT